MTTDVEQPTTETAAREKLARALRRMNELANASIENPALETNYADAVAAVSAAEAHLKTITG